MITPNQARFALAKWDEDGDYRSMSDREVLEAYEYQRSQRAKTKKKKAGKRGANTAAARRRRNAKQPTTLTLRKFVFGWKSGGGNSVEANNKAEALAKARAMGEPRVIGYGDRTIVTQRLVPDPTTLSDSAEASRTHDRKFENWD